jgi:hypothetical protein
MESLWLLKTMKLVFFFLKSLRFLIVLVKTKLMVGLFSFQYNHNYCQNSQLNTCERPQGFLHME